jgi:hypothetical protein
MNTPNPATESSPVRPKPEKIAEVKMGGDVAEIVREIDPNGAIVVHAVKKSPYVHERMHDLGRIDDEMYDAAERFRKDFEKANLAGRFATIDLFKSPGPVHPNQSDAVVEAGMRIRFALGALGMRKTGTSLSQSCVWFVVGCGHTLDQYALRIKNGGIAMTGERASGILTGSLERLVLHYGMATPADLKQRGAKRGFKEGVNYAAELADLFHIGAQGTPQEAIKAFAKLLREKVAKVKKVE